MTRYALVTVCAWVLSFSMGVSREGLPFSCLQCCTGYSPTHIYNSVTCEYAACADNTELQRILTGAKVDAIFAFLENLERSRISSS